MTSASLPALAANVRRLRNAHNLSVGQLAERSGIATATLFKIERERTNPTLDTLVALADTFSVTVSSMLAASADQRITVTRAGAGERISDSDERGHILQRVLDSGTLIEVHDAKFLPGDVEVSLSHGAGAREHVMVRSGRVSVGPLDEQVELGRGDYAAYPVDRSHRWRTVGTQPAEVLIFLTFPQHPVA